MGSQKHLQSESGSWKLERSWCHLAGVSGAFPHVHVKSSCRASDSSLMSPPHLCSVQGGWHAAGVEARDCKMCCSSVKGGFSHRIKNAWGTSWCHERSKSSLLFLPLFLLSSRLSKFSAIAVLVKPLGCSGIRRWAVEDIFATLLEVLISSIPPSIPMRQPKWLS